MMPGRVLDTLITRLQFTGDTKALERANKRVDALKKNLRGISTGMMAIGGAAVGASFFLGRTNLDAERASNNLEAVGQLTQSEMARLNAQARNLGASTSYSFRDVTRAQTELKLSGQSVNAVMASTPHVMHLAAAGQMEMGRAAQLVTNQLNAYGLSADEAQRVTDVIAAAATGSSTTIAQLGVSFRQTASEAAAMGLDIEQTAGMFMVLRNFGYTAEKTGVSVRNFLARTNSPTGEAERNLRSLFDGAGIAYEEFRGLLMTGQVDQAMGLFGQSLETLGSKQAQLGALTRIYGEESAGPILSLLTNLDIMKQVTDEVRTQTGVTQKMYETQTQGLVGSVGALKSAWEEMQLSIGEAGFSDELLKWMTRLKGAVDTVNEWINARKRLEAMKTASFGTAEWREYGEMSWYQKQMLEVQASMGSLIVPAIVGAIAIGGLAFALKGLIFVMKPVWTLFVWGSKLVRGIRPAFQAVTRVVQGIGPAFRTVRFGLWAMNYYARQFLTGPGRTLVQWGRNVASVFRGAGGRIVQAVARWGPRIGSAIVQWGPRIVAGIITWGPRIISVASAVFGSVAASTAAAFAGIALAGAAIGATIGVAIAGVLVGFDTLKAALDPSNLKDRWAAFTAGWTTLDYWKERYTNYGRWIAYVWGPRISAVWDWLGQRWQSVTGGIATALDWLQQQWQTFADKVSSTVGYITSPIGLAADAFRWLGRAALYAVEGIGAGVLWLSGQIDAGVGHIANALRALGVPVDWLQQQWQALQQRIGQALAWIADRAVDVASAIPDWAANTAGIDVRQLEDFASRLRNPLDEALPPTGPRVPIAPPNAATILAGGGGAGATTRNNQLSVGTIAVNISVDGSGDPRQAGAAAAEEFRANIGHMLETLMVDVDRGIAE